MIVALLLIISPHVDTPPWAVYKSPTGGYTIKMPAEAQSRSEKVEQRAGQLDVHSISAEENGLKFVVYHNDLAAPVPANRRATLLDAQRDGVVRGNRAGLRTETKIAVDGHPARDLVLDVPLDGGGAAILRVRIVLADRRVFQLYALAPEMKADRPEIAEFLDSFHILSARESLPGTPFSPAVAGFSARFPGDPPISSNDRIGDHDWTIFESKDGGSTFLVAHADISETALKDPRRILDLARDELIATTLGALTSERKTTLGRHPCRDIVAGIPVGEDPRGAVLTARIVLVGRRLYQIKVISPKDKKDPAAARAFLDSFRADAPK